MPKSTERLNELTYNEKLLYDGGKVLGVDLDDSTHRKNLIIGGSIIGVGLLVFFKRYAIARGLVNFSFRHLLVMWGKTWKCNGKVKVGEPQEVYMFNNGARIGNCDVAPLYSVIYEMAKSKLINIGTGNLISFTKFKEKIKEIDKKEYKLLNNKEWKDDKRSHCMVDTFIPGFIMPKRRVLFSLLGKEYEPYVYYNVKQNDNVYYKDLKDRNEVLEQLKIMSENSILEFGVGHEMIILKKNNEYQCFDALSKEYYIVSDVNEFNEILEAFPTKHAERGPGLVTLPYLGCYMSKDAVKDLAENLLWNGPDTNTNRGLSIIKDYETAVKWLEKLEGEKKDRYQEQIGIICDKNLDYLYKETISYQTSYKMNEETYVSIIENNIKNENVKKTLIGKTRPGLCAI